MSTPLDITTVETEIDTMTSIRGEMNTELIERSDEIMLLILSIISKTHGLLVGAPGTAKSMSGRSLMERVTGASYFELLLRKSMPVEQLVGPVSVAGLKNDEFRHITTGKLPETELGFLDEIFKANAVVLNALLSIINERIFHNNGTPMKVPLWCVIGASNELPLEEEMQAFRDRFAWTKVPQPVQSHDGFKAILRGQSDRHAGLAQQAQQTTITREQIVALQDACRQVSIDDKVLDDITKMKERAETEFNLIISPRRYGEGIKLAKAQALLNKRAAVSSEDLTLFQHVLWTDPEDTSAAFEVVQDFAGKSARVVQKLRKAFEPHHTELQTLYQQAKSNMDQETAGKLATVQIHLKQVVGEITDEIETAKNEQRDFTDLQTLLSEVEADRSLIREDIFG